MTKILKLGSIFSIWSILISLDGINAYSADNDTSILLEYFKILAKSGFLKKSHKAKYIASIKRMDIKTSYAEHHVCSGAIISKNSILTLAECTYDKGQPLKSNELTVVVGIQYGSMYDQFAQVIEVRKIRRHNKYHPSWDDYNIAILLLNETIAFIGDTVNSTPIATKPPNNYESCTGVGFGVLYYKDAELSQILEGELKIWPMRLCQSYLKQHRKKSNAGFCAGDLRDLHSPPCKILASEPLYCHDILYGVSIYSIGCESNRGFASVYVNLWEHLDWISQHAEMLHDKATALGFNISYFVALAISMAVFF